MRENLDRCETILDQFEATSSSELPPSERAEFDEAFKRIRYDSIRLRVRDVLTRAVLLCQQKDITDR